MNDRTLRGDRPGGTWHPLYRACCLEMAVSEDSVTVVGFTLFNLLFLVGLLLKLWRATSGVRYLTIAPGRGARRAGDISDNTT